MAGDESTDGEDEPSVEDLAKLVFGTPGQATEDAVADMKKNTEGIDAFLSAIFTANENTFECVICEESKTCQQCGGTGHWPEAPEVACLHCKGFGTCPHNR